MAEIAIPLLALGSLYVFSNKDKKVGPKKQENFINMGRQPQELPNTHVPNKNFPVESQPIDKTSDNYTRQYLNPNQTTDKFFNDNVGLRNLSDKTVNKEFKSISGNLETPATFRHNNMVPFFGSRVTQASSTRENQNILDNRQGAGSQNIIKQESAPLFKPEDNVQLPHGSQVNTDFYQSRVMPSSRVANVLPWEQEKVGPGLGLGYTTNGADGFNAGMMDREAWQPPTVDDLRTKSNPRVTFGLEGHEGPAQTRVQELGALGAVEKNRPDTDCALGPQRWFTTAGGNVGPMQHPEQMMPDTDKCTTEYYGSGSKGNQQGLYTKGHIEAPHRPDSTMCTNTNPAIAPGQGPSTQNDYGKPGYSLATNNRTVSCQSPNNGTMGILNSTVKAMMAPVMDALRPSRKENIIYNANQLGNVQAAVPSLPLTNPYDKPKTTNKEMTAGKVGLNYLNVSHIGAAQGGGYENTQIQAKNQQRNFGDSSTSGNVGNTLVAPMDETAWKNQHNNVNKTSTNWPMAGGTQLFNANVNVEIAKKDSNRENNRMQCTDFIRPDTNSIAQGIPSADMIGKIVMPQQYDQTMNSERINPDILQAFKNNPYAQSLTSF